MNPADFHPQHLAARAHIPGRIDLSGDRQPRRVEPHGARAAAASVCASRRNRSQSDDKFEQ